MENASVGGASNSGKVSHASMAVGRRRFFATHLAHQSLSPLVGKTFELRAEMREWISTSSTSHQRRWLRMSKERVTQ
jgi:hypothetical protein